MLTVDGGLSFSVVYASRLLSIESLLAVGLQPNLREDLSLTVSWIIPSMVLTVASVDA